jgi:hypothetical protein
VNASERLGAQTGEFFATLAIVWLGFLMIRRLLRDFGLRGQTSQLIVPPAIIVLLQPAWHYGALAIGSSYRINAHGWFNVVWMAAILIVAFRWYDRKGPVGVKQEITEK